MMTTPSSTPAHPLADLAVYLESRREAILQAWRQGVEADPGVVTASSLPRASFRDHIPAFLEAFGQGLRAETTGAVPAVQDSPPEGAEHGLQRWQQGYRLRELAREWGCLFRTVSGELESYHQAHPELPPATMARARELWGEACWRGVSDSASEYHRLHQTEAVGKVRDLQLAMGQLRQLERRRAEALREAAHDLRGNVGVVKTTTTILGREGVPEPVRHSALALLQKNVAALHEMLNDLIDLARLEAGHEKREVKPFDAAVLLSGLCDSVRPLAAERGLSLRAEGPASLLVEGDAAKVRRIAQNLVLNGLKYTEQGSVTVCWGLGGEKDRDRWVLCIRDTGPGFHAGPGAPLAGALKEATASAHEEERVTEGGFPASTAFAPEPDCRAVQQQAGEGIGLSIVKRLCELLDAGLELESQPGHGSLFQIKMPLRYDRPTA